MNRTQLDAFIAHHRLSSEATDAVLEIVNARPSVTEVWRFLVQLLQLFGVLSLAAGVVFFVAANWQEFGIASRFVLTQGVVVISVALALWRPPLHQVGRYALLMAFMATGALLALFGQTYQTGADTYELFLMWALLGSLFVVAGQWVVISAAWLLVFNLALLLYFGGQPMGGWLWVIFSSWYTSAGLLLIPVALNLMLWIGAMVFTSPWLARLALAFAFGFATWAGINVIDDALHQDLRWVVLLAVLVIEAAVAAYTMRQRKDVFPLALTVASVIILGTTALIQHMKFGDAGSLFVIALWLVVSSTLGGQLLMSRVRAWRNEAGAL